MPEEIIEISVNDDGTIEVHGTGFKGNSCDVLKKIAESMGEIAEEKFTPEYHQRVENKKKQQLGGGW